jgi:hypothetical protein
MNLKTLIIVSISLLRASAAFGQDPRLPSVNLGFTNMQAGNSRPPGWYYIQYIQVYQPGKVMDPFGKEIVKAPLVSSLILIQQIALISKTKVASGNLGFTLLLPVSKTSVRSTGSALPSINPAPVGDLIAGAFVQWYDKRLFGLRLAHRFGLNASFPTGSFQRSYDVNPGANRYRIFPNYQITLTPVKQLALSIKNNFYYSFEEIGSPNRPAIAYNLNYALEFSVADRLVLEAAGYYLTQLGQDSYNGDTKFYLDHYGINDTRERVFGYGPGVGYRTNGGMSLEMKGFWENGAQNRPEGFRGSLVMSYKL